MGVRRERSLLLDAAAARKRPWRSPKELVSDFEPGYDSRRMCERQRDSGHPVGAAAGFLARCRRRRGAPPFLPGRGDLQSILPLVEPGAFVRASSGLLAGGDGSVRTTYQLLQDCADSAAFRAGLATARVSDVLDFTWMVAEPMELRSVQELLEQLTATVLPGAAMRFVHYDEPRYRAALRLQIQDEDVPAAVGGVLAGWQGRPPGVDAGHLRFFLEPWATVQSGQAVDFDRFPLPFRPALWVRASMEKAEGNRENR